MRTRCSGIEVLEAQEDDLGGVLEEGGAVLLLPLLHPVPVDPERAAVDELAHAAERVWVPGQDVPGERAEPAVTAVHPDAGQHGDNQHPERFPGTKGSQLIFLINSEEGMCQSLLRCQTSSRFHDK